MEYSKVVTAKEVVVVPVKREWWDSKNDLNFFRYLESSNPIIMKASNRDLLVLLKDESMSNQAIELEVEQLNELLYSVESADTFCRVNEVIDMNRYKIHSEQKYLVQVMFQTELKPFVFINNKN